MNKEELATALTELSADYVKRKNSLLRTYCQDNNSYSIGDIFIDHIGSVKIEAIRYMLSENLPCCVYHGFELKKDGTPRKDGKRRTAFQRNELKK